MVGSHTSDLYQAIFDVEISREFELSDPSDDDLASLPSPAASLENVRPRPRTPTRKRTPSRSSRVDPDPPSPREYRRSRKTSTFSSAVEALSSTEVQSFGTKSPLSKLFGVRPQVSISTAPLDNYPSATSDTAAMVKKMESLLGEMRELPVQRLKDEIKELQVRCIVSEASPFS